MLVPPGVGPPDTTPEGFPLSGVCGPATVLGVVQTGPLDQIFRPRPGSVVGSPYGTRVVSRYRLPSPSLAD